MADDKGGPNIDTWQIVVAFIALMVLFGYLYFTKIRTEPGQAVEKRELGDVLGIPRASRTPDAGSSSSPRPPLP